MMTDNKWRTANSPGWMVLALLVIVALVVAPICAPICAAAKCGEAGHSQGSGGRCHAMEKADRGTSIAARAGAACGGGELAATLNGAKGQEILRQTETARTAAVALFHAGEILATRQNRREWHRKIADTSPSHDFSSSAVLRI